MKTISTIEGCQWVEDDKGVLTVDAYMRVDTDGSGSHHGDKTAQSATTYRPSLNADKDFFVVVPGKIRKAVRGVVVGCYVHVEDLLTGKSLSCVCGDVGPDDRSGEAATCVVKYFGLNPDPNRGGWDTTRRFRYTFLPGTAAAGYRLQPA